MEETFEFRMPFSDERKSNPSRNFEKHFVVLNGLPYSFILILAASLP
jgi:hypothetical protein